MGDRLEDLLDQIGDIIWEEYGEKHGANAVSRTALLERLNQISDGKGVIKWSLGDYKLFTSQDVVRSIAKEVTAMPSIGAEQ